MPTVWYMFMKYLLRRFSIACPQLHFLLMSFRAIAAEYLMITDRLTSLKFGVSNNSGLLATACIAAFKRTKAGFLKYSAAPPQHSIPYDSTDS